MMQAAFLITKLFQLKFTCSKSIIERLEEGVNMFKVHNKDPRTSLMARYETQ